MKPKPTIEQRTYLRLKADLARDAMTRAFEAADLAMLPGLELQAFLVSANQLGSPEFGDMPGIAFGTVDPEGVVQEVLVVPMHLSKMGMLARILERFRPLSMPPFELKPPGPN